MIHGIKIKNFRCFKDLEIEDCRRINVIVGDNGSGKTALLEAIFLALASSPEIASRLRQWRGSDFAFAGVGARQVEEAIWGDLFHRQNTNNTISIKLTGEGEERRSLKIARETARVFLPTRQNVKGFRPGHGLTTLTSEVGLRFEWTDARGHIHSYVPKITARGLEIPGPDEDLPDFFFFAATAPTSSIDAAAKFSVLSRANQQFEFVELFKREYGQIDDLSIEVSAGVPALYATVKGTKEKIPLTAVSGAINRILSILLSIVSRPRSVVLVDEADNGVYFKRHRAFCRTLLTFSREFDAQLFLSTHNEEWLSALAYEAGDKTDDLALWRVERSDGGPVIQQLPGTAFRAAEEYGGEIR